MGRPPSQPFPRVPSLAREGGRVDAFLSTPTPSLCHMRLFSIDPASTFVHFARFCPPKNLTLLSTCYSETCILGGLTASLSVVLPVAQTQSPIFGATLQTNPISKRNACSVDHEALKKCMPVVELFVRAPVQSPYTSEEPIQYSAITLDSRQSGV